MQFDSLNTVNQKIGPSDSCLDPDKLWLLIWMTPGASRLKVVVYSLYLRCPNKRHLLNNTSKSGTLVSRTWPPDSKVHDISAGSIQIAQGAGVGCVSLGSRSLELYDVQATRIRDTTEILKSWMAMDLNLTCCLKEAGVSFACQLAVTCVMSDNQLI